MKEIKNLKSSLKPVKDIGILLNFSAKLYSILSSLKLLPLR